MGASDYFTRKPRDDLDRVLQEEVANLAEFVSNEGRRRVFVLVAVLDGNDPRACSVASAMDAVERDSLCGELISELATSFGAR